MDTKKELIAQLAMVEVRNGFVDLTSRRIHRPTGGNRQPARWTCGIYSICRNLTG